MGRRTLLLVAALVVAAIGTVSIFLYVRGADDRALENQEPVRVLVAETLIKAGTLSDDAQKAGAFTHQDIPRAATVEGALDAIGPISGLVAVGDIFPGEQIVPQKFVQPGAASGLTIPAGKLAMSVQLGDPQRVAGFVKPGSEVAIFVAMTPPAGANLGGRPALGFTRLLLPRITVIAVGPTTLRPSTSGEGNTEQLPTAILTLALDQAQAQKVTYAVGNGSLYFGLLNKDSKVAPSGPTDFNNLFS